MNRYWILKQQSDNPTTYTKLSCYLPWIAKQYFMSYQDNTGSDNACTVGSGDSTEGQKTCRSTFSNVLEEVNELEEECKFPFWYGGVKYEKCILLYKDGFTYPVFQCPIRDITTKIDGVNSFPSLPIGEKICISDSSTELSPLDPNINCPEGE